MLTLIQKRHLRAYTCPTCGNPIGRLHSYPVTTDTLISRLTDTVPMHPTSAHKALGATGDLLIVWTVKTSSPKQPSGRLFERLPGDWFIHLQTPERIEFHRPTENGEPVTYDQIRETMMPAIRTARDAATSEEEIDDIARAIASLHRFFPKPTDPRQ
jgi:hypothetical protein